MRVAGNTFNGLGRLRGFGDARPINGPTGGLTYVAGAPAGCPLLSDGTCGDPVNGSYPCDLVRECDSVTKAVHYEYTLPSGQVKNANMWTVNGDGTFTWLGPDGTPASPPPGVGLPNPGGPLQSVGNVNWFQGWQQQQKSLTPAANPPPANPPASKPPAGNPPANNSAGNKTTGNGAGGSISTAGSGASTIVAGIPDNYLYLGVAAVAAFFMFKGQ